MNNQTERWTVIAERAAADPEREPIRMTFRQDAMSAMGAVHSTQDEIDTLQIGPMRILAVINERWDRETTRLTPEQEIAALRSLVAMANSQMESSFAPLSALSAVASDPTLRLVMDRALSGG